MENAIETIADLVPDLEKLKKVLEEIQNQFEQFGNYEKRLLANKIAPTNVHIVALQPFFIAMRDMVKRSQLFEEAKETDLPVSISSLYRNIRDTIYRAGKYEKGGMNQNPDGIKISDKKIYLGKPPGNWKKSVHYILRQWDTYMEFKPKFASAYSIEAFNYIKNYFVLIDQIDVLKENMKKLNLLQSA